MAKKDENQVDQTQDDTETKDVDKLKAEANEAQVRAGEDQAAAANAGMSDEQCKAEDSRKVADDARARAAQAEADEAAAKVVEPTKAGQAKSLSALSEPDRDVGDHLAQKFSRTPENPQLANGLDPDLEREGKVKLVMETSDSKARGAPDVCYVHPDMVGDYLRSGWSKAA